jgi:hypothetical protein
MTMSVLGMNDLVLSNDARWTNIVFDKCCYFNQI